MKLSRRQFLHLAASTAALAAGMGEVMPRWEERLGARDYTVIDPWDYSGELTRNCKVFELLTRDEQ